MPLPLNLGAHVLKIYNNVSQGSKYYYLELLQGSGRNKNIPSTLMAGGENINSNQLLSFIQGMKEAGLITIGALPQFALNWDYRLSDSSPGAEAIMRDRPFMSEKMYLYYALREEWLNRDGTIAPSEFLPRWQITQDNFLSGIGSIPSSTLIPQFSSIPITWTDKGYLNLSSVTQAQILGTLADYYGDSIIYTYIVLQSLRGNTATQAIDPSAIASTWGIPTARLNTHLIQLQSKLAIDLIAGQISLTWIKKPIDTPSKRDILERRGKIYSEAGYLLYALAFENLTELSTASLITDWALTEQQLLNGLEELRKGGFLAYAIASSIKWLI